MKSGHQTCSLGSRTPLDILVIPQINCRRWRPSQVAGALSRLPEPPLLRSDLIGKLCLISALSPPSVWLFSIQFLRTECSVLDSGARREPVLCPPGSAHFLARGLLDAPSSTVSWQNLCTESQLDELIIIGNQNRIARLKLRIT